MPKKMYWLFLLIAAFTSNKAFAVITDLQVTVIRDANNIPCIYAKNVSFIPITIELNLKLQNADVEVPLPIKKVIPPKSEVKLCTVKPQSISFPWHFSSSYTTFFGNCLSAKHDDSVAYRLPFNTDPGECVKVIQGYNGNNTHMGQKALDFKMPINTPIVAARAGIVVDTKQDSEEGCMGERCRDKANFISILHADGSIACYSHLMYNGVIVQPGQEVIAGTLIGYSGNTGYSNSPHLDFKVVVPSLQKEVERAGVATLFLVNGEKRLLQKNDCLSMSNK